MASSSDPSNTSRISSETSLSIGAFSPPQTEPQWRRALLDVKRLLLNQQYKQCAMRCNQLLDTAPISLHPIRTTYLHYYAATAYEYMGRAAHVYSAVKIPLLTDAMERFQTAYDSLPAPVSQPPLSSKQTYSHLSHHSPTRSSRSPVSPVTVAWSPVVSPARDASPASESSPSADVLSAQNLSAHNSRHLRTPPPFLLGSCPSVSSGSSVTTAFCITPPPAARVSRVDHNGPPPAFHIPPPTRDPPPPPQARSPLSDARDQLVSFNSARNGLPRGGSMVRSIARMIDNSVLAGDDDPFVTRALQKPRLPVRSPLRLSPIKLPVELKDPAKQSELIPAPLAIRKSSGEILMCSSAMVIREDPKHKESEREVKRPDRTRPPRLPLKVIPSGSGDTNTEKTSSSVVAPQPRRVSPLLPSPMSMPTSAPQRSSPPRASPSSHTKQSRVPVLGSPFTSRPGSPTALDTNSFLSWSTSDSPTSISLKHADANNTEKWLSQHLTAEVEKLRKQIKHISSMQQARRTRNASMSRSVSFWTFTPVKPNTDSAESPGSPKVDGPNIDEYGNILRVETKAQRMKRLRKEDWVIGLRSKHSRFKGTGYYDKLCEDALAELGPTGVGSNEWLKR